MGIRVGSFNVENLFRRVVAMQEDGGSDVLDAYAKLGQILFQPTYKAAAKRRIVDLLVKLGLGSADDAGEFAILRQNHGRLIRRDRRGVIQEVVANGRGDWVGFIELKTATVSQLAIENTAQVIADVKADVLGIVEVENRPTLKAFAVTLLADRGADYPHAMVIDGNDDRGIDVGLLAKKKHDIIEMRSHVDDVTSGLSIFSRDCPEYEVEISGGGSLLVMVNHFKSKGFGKQSENDARRKAQAARVAAIYRQRIKDGAKNIVVLGDLNDTPDSEALKPLLSRTDLQDITEHANFQSDGRPGTFGNGSASQKIDYVLLSPALFRKVTGGGIFREGVWGGTNGDLFPRYDNMQSKIDQASDHAAIFADLDV